MLPEQLIEASEPPATTLRVAPVPSARRRGRLARGRIDDTLATLHRHARRFAQGQLAEERDSLYVQALVAKRDFAQARERATRFRRQHPSSLFQPAVDLALQSIP